ncbi:cytochrome b5-like Heme/Steroid binding domain containing protein [Plasmodium ovale curtisi]|uniref:Cytochrome b5-like Heme/Steroid binding domain containing protein n=1 Tax=Plasmodium ovale curtisi TaxID=864141 RepID=A0A1A8W2Y2_PLAOA|nr:cytochrome b5-like Heme/Steroid binding domain containing protein [Plasmodium ovale curtisi]SBS94593.1 cytochrome b5-like Heme/Steroid binding domain containing protein [Plasmodium ovale curtisi]
MATTGERAKCELQKRNKTELNTSEKCITNLFSPNEQREDDKLLKPANVSCPFNDARCDNLRRPMQGANQMLYANISEGLKKEENAESGVKTFTREEVSKHNKKNDAWVIYKNKVYNVTYYILYHPGGEDILLEQAGQDVTDHIFQYHSWVNVERILQHNYVGKRIKLIKFHYVD